MQARSASSDRSTIARSARAARAERTREPCSRVSADRHGESIQASRGRGQWPLDRKCRKLGMLDAPRSRPSRQYIWLYARDRSARGRCRRPRDAVPVLERLAAEDLRLHGPGTHHHADQSVRSETVAATEPRFRTRREAAVAAPTRRQDRAVCRRSGSIRGDRVRVTRRD